MFYFHTRFTKNVDRVFSVCVWLVEFKTFFKWFKLAERYVHLNEEAPLQIFGLRAIYYT